jgi:hypothetical protein
MLCEVCQRDAVGWCKGCGAYLCADHGGERCFRCAGLLAAVQQPKPPLEQAVYTLERDSRWGGKGYLQCYVEPSRPTIHIDDPGPPACYECGALTRRLCAHCHALFCPEHAGGKELCLNCLRSSRLGMAVLAIMLLLFVLLMFFCQMN